MRSVHGIRCYSDKLPSPAETAIVIIGAYGVGISQGLASGISLVVVWCLAIAGTEAVAMRRALDESVVPNARGAA